MNFYNFEYTFTAVSSYWSCWRYMFGSGNGLATDWWQAITWTNADYFCRYMMSPGLNELNHHGLVMLNGNTDLHQLWLGSGNGSFPDSTKPLLESVFTNYQWYLVGFNWRQYIITGNTQDINYAFKVKSPSYLIPANSLGVKHTGPNKGVGWHQTHI